MLRSARRIEPSSLSYRDRVRFQLICAITPATLTGVLIKFVMPLVKQCFGNRFHTADMVSDGFCGSDTVFVFIVESLIRSFQVTVVKIQDRTKLFQRAEKLFLSCFLGLLCVFNAIDENGSLLDTDLLHHVLVGAFAGGERKRDQKERCALHDATFQ
tara:strand:+ start:8976 stop:9446 length:471 start_codon:yes stop_codon:yes gene_type:complete